MTLSLKKIYLVILLGILWVTGCRPDDSNQNEIIIELLEIDKELAVNEKALEIQEENLQFAYLEINRLVDLHDSDNQKIINYLWQETEILEMIKMDQEVLNDSIISRKTFFCDSIVSFIDTTETEVRVVFRRVCNPKITVRQNNE